MTGAPSPSFEIPADLHPVFSKFFAAEYAYFTPRGDPLCWPVSPYWYPERGVLAIATGLAYPNKADYAKLNPKVALFFSDPMFSGLEDPPKVLVQGNATVVDQDIQANTDRYVREMRTKFPQARFGLNPLTVRLLDFYLPRLWVEITPVRIMVWSGMNPEPEVFGLPKAAPPDPSSPQPAPPDPSSPQPAAPGAASSSSMEPETLPAELLSDWIRLRGEAVVAVRGPDGYPMMSRSRVWEIDGGIGVERPPGTGPAALTMHYAALGGIRFDTKMARGRVESIGTEFVFRTQRIAGFLGSRYKEPSGGIASLLARPLLSLFPLSVIGRIAQLRRRLRIELQRRGQPMPRLRVPR